jgi:hypothetical protein
LGAAEGSAGPKSSSDEVPSASGRQWERGHWHWHWLGETCLLVALVALVPAVPLLPAPHRPPLPTVTVSQRAEKSRRCLPWPAKRFRLRRWALSCADLGVTAGWDGTNGYEMSSVHKDKGSPTFHATGCAPSHGTAGPPPHLTHDSEISHCRENPSHNLSRLIAYADYRSHEAAV